MLFVIKGGQCKMKLDIRLNEQEFFRFSWFDVLRRRKLWRSPAAFAAILGACAAVCFVMRERQGAVVLGAVLLAVGLGIPAAYFLSYCLSLKRQARERKLAGGRYVYTIGLGDSGVAVDNGPEHADYPWGQIIHAYRGSDATYLYITPQRAFLIPHGCVSGGAEALWAVIGDRLPAERQTVL